jgi:intraflagellar transport protein 122
MLCYSGGGTLSIKTADFPVHQQKLQGFVVGFKGSKVFCLQYVSMATIDVPQTASMIRYIENRDFDSAYRVARLGVTESDWRVLGRECLLALQLELALKCYTRVKDIRFIEKIHRILQQRRGLPGKGGAGASAAPSDPMLLADIKAYLGQYREAAEIYKRQGRLDLAMGLFLDLRQFEEARRWAEEVTREQGENEIVRDLMGKQAEWFEEVGDFAAASSMYRAAGKYERAVSLLVRAEQWDLLAELARGTPKTEARALGAAADAFRRVGRAREASEIYRKLEDFKSVASMLVEAGQWEEALQLLSTKPEVREIVTLPYAAHLAMQDRFEEARLAYKAAGRPEESVHVLEELALNAVEEARFADAGFYFYHLAMESLSQVARPAGSMSAADRRALDRYSELYHRAELYYAYDLVHRSVEDPFSRADPHTLFNASRYLLMRMLQRTDLQKKEAPLGISLAKIVRTLARLSEELGAHKLARQAYQRLGALRLPPRWQEEAELAAIRIRSKPFVDSEALQPVCYRCGAANPLLNLQGDQCTQCHADFIRSFLTFELLPLIEFHLDPDVSDEEALRLLEMEPPADNPLARAARRRRQLAEGQAREVREAGAQLLRLEDDYEDREIAEGMEDPFVAQRDLRMIQVGRETLLSLKRSEVLIRTWPNRHIAPQYFRVVDPDTPVCLGPDGHFYEADEYEMKCLEQASCPFSRSPVSLEGEVTGVQDRHYVDGEPRGGAGGEASGLLKQAVEGRARPPPVVK